MTQTTPPEDQGWSSDPASPAASGAAPTATTYASSEPAATRALPPARRPGMVTGAGITLIVLGALTLLFGLIVALGALLFAGAMGSVTDAGGAVPPEMEGLMGAFAGLAVVLTVIVLAFGALQVLAGIKVLGGRNWARITGIVLAVIGGVLALLGLTGAEGGGVILNLAFVAANAFVIWALIATGSWFAPRTA